MKLAETLKQQLRTSAWLYVIAWIIGLCIPSPSVKLGASAQTVLSAYAGHGTATRLSFLITEGVTGLLFGLLAFVFIRYARRQSNTYSTVLRTLTIISTAVLALSIIMAVLGCMLAGAVESGAAQHAANVTGSINRIDGVKMWLLALFILLSLPLAAANRSLRIIAYLATVALFISGIAYTFLLSSLAWSVYISGVLLLIWAAVFGSVAIQEKGARASAADH